MQSVKRSLPYNSLRNLWKKRQIDLIYEHLHHPGFNQNYANKNKIRNIFKLYHNCLKIKNIASMERYFEPVFFNELNEYMKATKNNLFVNIINDRELQDDDIKVEFK